MAAREALRRRREELDLSQEQVAHLVGVSTTAYRGWEDGTTAKLRVGKRVPLAKALQWDATQLNQALEGGMNGQAIPIWLTLYASLEQDASRLWSWHPFTVSALLQTADYARAVEGVSTQSLDDEAIARRVELRRVRQAVLTRDPDPLQLAAVLDESVLLRETGGTAVMDAQRRHLARMAELPNVDLRILPLDSGVHAGGPGPFTLLASQGDTVRIVCVNEHSGIRYLEDQAEIDRYVNLHAHLSERALAGDRAIDLILGTIKER